MCIPDEDNVPQVGPATDSIAARLADLCARQIEAAGDEAFVDVDELSTLFLTVMRRADAIADAMGGDDVSPGTARPGHELEEMKKVLQDILVKLQFADRLNQRLTNVSKNLAAWAGLMRPRTAATGAADWSIFLRQVRATYTVEQERQMFDAIFSSTQTASVQRRLEGSARPEQADRNIRYET